MSERCEIERGRKRETRLRERNERKNVTEKRKNEGKNGALEEGFRRENEGGDGSKVHYKWSLFFFFFLILILITNTSKNSI